LFAGVMVAVDSAAFQFDKLYSYNVPEELRSEVRIGSRVLVPFGNSKRMGIVLGSCDPDGSYKSIIDSETGDPVITDEMVGLIRYLKDTTFCTYYDAVKAVLPKNIRLVPDGDLRRIVQFSEAHTKTVYRAVEGFGTGSLTARQKEIYSLLSEPMSYSEIRERLSVSRDTLNRMEKAGAVERAKDLKDTDPYLDIEVSEERIPEMSASQNRAYEEIKSATLEAARPGTALFYGVTSSGKTVVYLRLIEDAVASGKGVILLVPEIALATQMIVRLRSRFGERVGIIHSALSDTERTIQWKNIRDGAYDVVVGTRSAVFAPLSNIGLIIIDEEQEEAYNSDQAPRYKAVSVALKRASDHSAGLVLGSATPSVESYYRAVSGQYRLVSLNERYNDMPLPKVTVSDMREELIEGNDSCIGSVLYEKIRQRLDLGQQCILLLNRRGYRTVTICRSCKKIVMCDSCSMPMVWHKSDGTHRCHYCSRIVKEITKCPDCGGELRHTGIGTQRVEEELQTLFPDARVLRVDLDSTSRKGTLRQSLRDFEDGKYDIMIGTQMIAKGLDFPNVTLAGVLSVDSMLLMPSYRAYERTFDMLTQVVGRSGRGTDAGEAVIQTIDPGNNIIQLAAEQAYTKFYDSEIILRKAHLYPPFCSMCSVVFSSGKENDARASAYRFEKKLSQVFGENPSVPVRIMNPSPLRVVLVNGSYRWRILIKSRGDRAFRECLSRCLTEYKQENPSDRTRIYVDMTNESDI
jgi:primosomal protein N''